MYRYRVQLSKIVRFAEVEVGISQGGENNGAGGRQCVCRS